jgi:hypothetical protein
MAAICWTSERRWDCTWDWMSGMWDWMSALTSFTREFARALVQNQAPTPWGGLGARGGGDWYVATAIRVRKRLSHKEGA